ncbi:hypothetical protein WL480_05300 [Staphylococcus hominis]|uniref:hypothetical protein n=1 Tax=Staphylococcus hominis TaxID=1290 RepID=UPI0030C346F6
MNELEQQEFDYSLVDNETAIKLEKYEKQLNRIYNSYSIEVGEVLYNAHEDLSNYGDGTFIKWAESKGIKKASVYNYINAYKFVQRLDKPEEKDTFLSQPKTLQYAMSKPSAKEEINQEVFNGNVKTTQEYKEMERKAKEYEQQLKQRDEQNVELQSQVEQAQRSEEIAKKQLEDAESREPEVIEKYMEPEDYQSIKNMNEHLESEREYYKKLADDFRNEVKDMMDQPSNVATFTKENDNEDYTPILLKILEPSELFIQNYKNHINEQEVINKLEKIIKKLKEQ